MNDRFSESTEKIAVVDIGANSVRINVYDINTETGRFSVCDSARSMLGLAAYSVDGRLSSDGEGRLFAVLREYLARANSVPTDAFFAFATASLRGLSNTDKVLASIKRRLGIEVAVISGDEEAELDFFATLGRFGSDIASKGITVDMGGGSTEIVGFENGRKTCGHSFRIGCLAVSKRFVRNPLAITASELSDIQNYALSELSTHPEFENIGGTAYLIGGTARAAAKIFMGVRSGLSSLDGFEMTADDLFSVRDTVLSDGGAAIKKYSPDRTATVAPGVCALCEAIRYCGAERLIISGAGVREGFVAKIIEERKNAK